MPSERQQADDDIHVIMDILAPSHVFSSMPLHPMLTSERTTNDPDTVTAGFYLHLQKDGESQLIKNYVAPVKVQMTFDGFNPLLETMTAQYQPENGKAVPLALKVNRNTAQISFTLTGNGQMTFTRAPAPVPDEVYQVTLEEGLTGGYLTASPLSGKAGTTSHGKSDSRQRLPAKQAVCQWHLCFHSENFIYLYSGAGYRNHCILYQKLSSSEQDDDDDDSSTATAPNQLLESTGRPAYAVSGTWSQSGDQWHFYLENGELARSTWICTLWNGIYEWFYFDENGIMKTGWLTLDGRNLLSAARFQRLQRRYADRMAADRWNLVLLQPGFQRNPWCIKAVITNILYAHLKRP